MLYEVITGKERPCSRRRVGIAGESGSGKTVLAYALASAFERDELRTAVIQLDDYSDTDSGMCLACGQVWGVV